MSPEQTRTVEQWLERRQQRVDLVLARLMPPQERDRLAEAMHYAVMAPGKRLRPVLMITTAEVFSIPIEETLPVAVALEMAHTYSLIHDDLPAMDDDELRRGQPTVHRRFDEATAILAGDALQTLAFDTVVRQGARHFDPETTQRMLRELTWAIGADGMVLGQMLDLEAEGMADQRHRALEKVQRIHSLKTGRLFTAAVRMGGWAGGATDATMKKLTGYGEQLGLAFQIMDDLLDIEGTVEEMGKEAGRDGAAGKATYPAVLGVERARMAVSEASGQAVSILQSIAKDTSDLEKLVHYLRARRY